jgi:uncharacterized integral membrane protein
MHYYYPILVFGYFKTVKFYVNFLCFSLEFNVIILYTNIVIKGWLCVVFLKLLRIYQDLYRNSLMANQ